MAPMPDSVFPRADEENLTRDEAKSRSVAVTVVSYDVHVDLSKAAAQGAVTYPVTTRVEFTVHEGAEAGAVFLDYLGESVDQLVVNGQERDLAPVVGEARIHLTELRLGSNTVQVGSTSRFSRSGEGLHRFVDPADEQVYLYTQFEPADCRRVYPVFDQPDMKAVFRFSMTGPETWQLRSNSAEIARQHVPGAAEGLDGVGLVTVDFAETKPLSSYITALLAGPYHLVESQWGDIDLGVLCRDSMAEHFDAEEILKITTQGLEFFTREFDYPYPWGKYDQVFVPEYNLGAMENPGLVTFTEAYVFDSAATQAQHETRANTILHEMAHMWFGDLVTMTWWDDLWLKESFADYMGAYALDVATEFTTSWISFANGRKAWAYIQDQLPTTHPIVAHITDLEAADQNFDGITYAKGASVLKQLAAYAGQDAFRDAARYYFRQFAFSNATLADFLSVLETTTGRDMTTWAQAWLQTAGIPVLSAHTQTGEVIIEQSGTDPSTGQDVARPHVIQIGVFTLNEAAELARSNSVSVDLPAEAPSQGTTVPGVVVPQAGPRLILANDADLTYAKLHLDEASVDAALNYPMNDPLARATVWAALWSMVRDGQLPATRFIEAVTTLGLQIPEVSVAGTLLRQADRACERFLGTDHQADYEQRLAQRLAHFLSETDDADLQRAAARTLASVSARHESQLDLLTDLLDGRAEEYGITDLAVDEELRWAFLQALAAHGRVTMTQLDEELAGQDTARGRIAHRRALASLPEPDIKQAAFDQAISGFDADGQELSNDHLSAVVDGFRTDTSADGELTGDFVVEYFASVRSVWEQMTQGQATRVIEGLYPASEKLGSTAPEQHPVVLLTTRWLEQHDDAPEALRRLMIEEQDHLIRALRVQAAAA